MIFKKLQILITVYSSINHLFKDTWLKKLCYTYLERGREREAHFSKPFTSCERRLRINTEKGKFQELSRTKFTLQNSKSLEIRFHFLQGISRCIRTLSKIYEFTCGHCHTSWGMQHTLHKLSTFAVEVRMMEGSLYICPAGE